MAATVSAIVNQSGRLDVVVNNAGVVQLTPFEHAHVEDLEESLRTHFWGTAARDSRRAPKNSRARPTRFRFERSRAGFGCRIGAMSGP